MNLSAGEVFTIKNPSYPGGNAPLACSWKFTIPEGYSYLIKCTEPGLSKESNCSLNTLRINNANLCNALGPFVKQLSGSELKVSYSYSGRAPQRLFCNVTTEPNLCNCGNISPNGGRNYVAKVKNPVAQCGATIITPNSAITSVFCLLREDPSIVTLEVANKQVYAIAKVHVHPEYALKACPQHDLGVVITKKDIVFSAAVGMACMPYRKDLAESTFFGKTVTFSGFGLRNTTVVKMADYKMTVIGSENCQATYKCADHNHICTKEYTNTLYGKTYLPGSGVYYRHPKTNRDYLVGMVPYLKYGGQSIGLNTRITSDRIWIDSFNEYQMCKE